MPTRAVVTKEMVNAYRDIVLFTLDELNKNRCLSVLIILISSLYELTIAAFTLKYSNGRVASYADVSKNLPVNENTHELAAMRDKLTHDRYKIYKTETDFIKVSCEKFSKENFKEISEVCFGFDMDLYGVIMRNCDMIDGMCD